MADSDTVLRFTVNERLQHGVLMVCVLVLVLTGFELRFADTWLGRTLIDLEGGMANRGLAHRVAAIGIMALAVYHAFYAVFSRRGHAQLMAMVPGGRDLADAWQAVKHNLGAAKEPAYGRFDFRQKLQYWAVGLGIVSMSLSGLVLWFETVSMAVLPKWVWDLMRIIHSDEAVLIFVVLFLWHLYDTHLRPGVFPMDRSWLTGTITKDAHRRRHRREHLRLHEAAADAEAPR